MRARFKIGGEGLHEAFLYVPTEFRVMIENQGSSGSLAEIAERVEIRVTSGSGDRLPLNVYLADGVQFYVHYIAKEVSSFSCFLHEKRDFFLCFLMVVFFF